MNSRGWSRRAAFLVLIIVLPGARSAAQVFGRVVEDVTPLNAIATGPAAPDRPALAAIDGRESTSWAPAESSTAAGVIIVLPATRAIAGVRILGRVSADTRISVSWLAADGTRPFFGGEASGPFDGEIVLDLSLERAVVDRLLVAVEGPRIAEDIIAEIVPMAFSDPPSLQLLPPDDIVTGGNPAGLEAAEWLADSDVRTSWRTGAAGDVMTDVTTRDVLSMAGAESTAAMRRAARLTAGLPLEEPTSAAPRWAPGRLADGEAEFSYDVPIHLDRLRMYFTEPPQGGVNFQVQMPTGWQSVVSIPGATIHTGWMNLDLPTDVSGTRFKISLTRPGDDGRCLTEVELWGTRPDSPHGVVSGEIVDIGPSADLLFRLLPPKPGAYLLELMAGGPALPQVVASLNGSQIVLRQIVSFAGRTLYQAEVETGDNDSDELWLSITEGETVTAAACRLRERARTGEWGLPGARELADGLLLASVQLDGTVRWELDRTLEIDAVEVRGPSAGSTLVRVLVDTDWTELAHASSSTGLVVFSCGREIRGLEISAIGSLSEITLLGSPTADVPPAIRLIQPEGEIAPKNAILLGTVIEASTNVTVNTRVPRRIGPFFLLDLDTADPVAEERYRVVVQAVDGKGRTAEVERSWIKTGIAPLTVDQAGTLHSTMGATFEIAGRTADQIYRIEVNGVPVSTIANRFTATVPVSVGYNTIVVTARRISTGTIEAARLVRVIRHGTGFGVEVTSPVPGTFVASASVTIGGRLTGAIPPITVEVNGAPAVVAGDRFSTAVPLRLAEGGNEILVTAHDGAGRTAVTMSRVVVDTNPPVVAFVRPASGAIVSSGIVTLSVRASDANPIAVTIDGAIAVGAGDRYELSVSFTDGAKQVMAVATDPAGNRATVSSTFMVDTTPPEPFIVTVDPGGWTGDSSPVVSFTALDATSGIARYELSVDAGPGIASTSPCTIGPLLDGVHSIEVNAFDRAGNSRTAGSGAFIDTVAPPAPAAFRGIEGPDQVELAWEQPADDVESYQIERTPAWAEGARTISGFSLVDGSLPPGSSYTYRIVAVDRAGHESPPVLDTSMVGIAVAPVEPDESGGMIEFEDVALFYATEALPERAAQIEVTTASSPELEEKAMFGLASPIYEFAVSVYDDTGMHRESGTEFSREFIGTIRYDETMLPDGFPEENVGLFYWDTMWSQWVRVDKFAVDVELNTILFATSHFTLFSVQPTMIQDLSPQELADVGYSPFKSQVTQAGVTVSVQGGSAMTEVTEFVLPGKAGFDFVLRRMYDTATARGDSPGSAINLALSFALNNIPESTKYILELANGNALGTLLKGFGESRLSEVSAKIDSIFRNCGDYAYATGVGWRLSLPYMRTAGGRVLVRTPSGSFYPVNNMSVADASYVLNTRRLVLENHEGENFTLVVRQILIPTNVTTREGGGHVLTLPVLSWFMTDAELIMKDGTTWSFDTLGRVKSLVDATGTNTIVFSYGGLLGYFLETITDSMGRVLRFSYENGGPLDIVPRISSIALENDPQARSVHYTYTEKTIGGLTIPGVSLLASATDAVGRTWNYGYDWTLMLEGSVSVKVNLLGLMIDLIPGARLFLKDTVPPSLTLSGRLSSEIACTLGSIEGPGSGYVRIRTTKRSFVGVAIEMTDFLFGFIATGIEGTLEFPSQLYTSSVEEYANLGGRHLKTTSFLYHFRYAGNHQIVNTETCISDGKTVTTHDYTTIIKQRKTYLTGVDYLTSLDLFMAPATYREVVPYETGFTVATRAGKVLEATTLAYDLATMRLIGRTVRRGDEHSTETTWEYDIWGNVTETAEITRDDAASTRRTTTTSFFISRKVGSYPNARPIDSPYPLPILTRPRMDLPLVQRVSYSIPETGGGSTGARQNVWYRYDSLGRKTAETADISGRRLETRFSYDGKSELIRTVCPAGNDGSVVTRIERDYSPPSHYIIRTIREDVELADGVSADLESVIWNDRSSGLKVFERDARGFLSAWSYDAVGRPTKVIEPDDSDPLNADPLLGTAFLSDNPTTTIVYNDSTYTVTVTGARGQETVYDYDQAGRLEKITRLVRRLDDEGRPLASGAQAQETLVGYDGWGSITSIVDPNGHRTDYRYDALSRLSEIEYPAGDGPRPRKTISFDYSTNRQTTVDERGYVTIENYDMADRRIATTSYPDLTGGKGRAVTTSTLYDGMGRESVSTDELGGVTVKRYDERGNTVEIVSAVATFFEGGVERTYAPRKVMEYDDAGALILESFVTADGTFATRHINNRVGLPLTTEHPYTDRTSGSPVNALARELYGYDAVGNRVFLVDANDAARPPAERKPSVTSYSARGKVLAQTDRAGNRTTYAYDADDNVVKVTDPRGNDPVYRGTYSAWFWYDDANRLVHAIIPSAGGGDASATVAFEYDPRGNLLQRSDTDGSITTYTYSARNKPVTELKRDQGGTTGILTERTYDDAALEITMLVGGLYRTSFFNDGLGRRVLTSLPSGSYEKLGYDAAGNVNLVEDGNGNATTYTFDSYRRPLVETGALGASRRCSYDARGNMIREIDANGNIRLMGYDELGRMVSERRADGASYSWAYDAAGYLVKMRDAAGIVTTYEYTDDYRVDTIIRTDGSREQVQTFSWDRAGNRLSSSNELVTIEYNTSEVDGYQSDPFGRVRAQNTTIAGQRYTASWNYDEAGRVTRLVYPSNREQTWSYDGIGLLAEVNGWTAAGSVRRDGGGHLLGYSLVNGTKADQGWNLDGKLERLTYQAGAEADLPSYAFAYDRAGDMIAKSGSSYRYDELRRLLYADETDRTRVDREADAGSVVDDHQGQGELVFGSSEVELKLDCGSTSIGVELGGELDLIGLTVYPDAPGHRVRARNIEIWTRSGSAYVRVPEIGVDVASDGALCVVFREPVVTSAVKVHCLYDERDANDQVVDYAEFKNLQSKLMVVTYRMRRQVQEYRYDAKGNRLEVARAFTDGSGSTFARDSLSYWPSSDRVKKYSGWTYVYDAKGRLIEKGTEYVEGVGFAPSSGQYMRYEWDLFDRLEAMYRSDSGFVGAAEAVRYGYDADGMRVQRIIEGEVTRWVYGPDGNPILESSGVYAREFVYAEGKILGYWETAGDTTRQYFTLTDQVGSVVSVTDEHGAEVSRRDYLAFGGEAGVEGSLATPAFFTGKEWDSVAELYYYNARWYDPELGRFISEDPIMDGPNWYAYVGNSPLMKTDPTGLGPWDVFVENAREFARAAKKDTNALLREVKDALFPPQRTAQEVRDTVKAVADQNVSVPPVYTCVKVFREAGDELGMDMSPFAGMNANTINVKLNEMAESDPDVIRVTAEEAQRGADTGEIVFASREKYTGIKDFENHPGHIAFVVADPTRSTKQIASSGPLVAGGGLTAKQMDRTITDAYWQFSYPNSQIEPDYFIYRKRKR
jgi:RHS repeat-associated protein